MQTGLKVLSSRAKRKIFQSWEAPYELTSVQAGEVEAVHKITTENVYRQQLVGVQGQADILTMGLPYVCPYNVNSIMNPILVMCLGLGYFFNMYRNKPLVREGGVVIMTHPTPWEFHPVHHPSYIDFFEQVLADTTDPAEIEKKYEKQYAEDEWYIHLYRTSYAYHGVHPFYMWYWGAHAMDHLGRVIIVGGDQRAVRRLGFVPASTLQDALEMASDVVGRRRDDHAPSQPAHRHGRRELTMATNLIAAKLRRVQFPFRAPTVPAGVEVQDRGPTLGSDYDTEWARTPAARIARAGLVNGFMRPLVYVLGTPRRRGLDRLTAVDGPVVFAANHHSHVDTPTLLTSIPERWRKKLVVGAAADYFFGTRVTSALVGARDRRNPDRAHQSRAQVG